MSQPVAKRALSNKEEKPAVSNEHIKKRFRSRELAALGLVTDSSATIDICQQLRTTSLCMNRILGEPALGRHVRGYYVGVIMGDVLDRLVEIRRELESRGRVKAGLVDELVGYMEYYADSLDFMTEAMTTMMSFGQGNCAPRLRYVVLRVLPHFLQTTCKHVTELGVLFFRFVWETLRSPDFNPSGQLRHFTGGWYTQFMVTLVNGGAVLLLIRMAHNIQPYLEHSTRDRCPLSAAYDAILEPIWEILDFDSSRSSKILSRELRRQLEEAKRIISAERDLLSDSDSDL